MKKKQNHETFLIAPWGKIRYMHIHSSSTAGRCTSRGGRCASTVAGCASTDGGRM